MVTGQCVACGDPIGDLGVVTCMATGESIHAGCAGATIDVWTIEPDGGQPMFFSDFHALRRELETWSSGLSPGEGFRVGMQRMRARAFIALPEWDG